jgi:hypothetical protein
VSSVLDQLATLLARFDDESYVALANRGLVRRARKDLEQQSVAVLEQSNTELVVGFGSQRIRFDYRGPSQAQCDCPANSVCQHIVAASMGLQQLLKASATDAAEKAESESDAVTPLQAELLALSAMELTQYAGKAAYRWAWQYVQDHDLENAILISGTQHLVLSLQHPRITFRYMGGGLQSMMADVELAQAEKYRVAVVLAFQRINGQELTPPTTVSPQRSQALDLGMDHVLIEPRDANLHDSRARLRIALRKILVESVELGLAHLSRGIYERYSTLAVWAQGAEYYRLALLTRRIADHVELLLDRAGGADELRLLDELSVANGLVCALEAAASQAATPHHLVGRARSRYEATNSMELFGLGAQPWSSPAGYVGLTMIFWSPTEQAFLSCSDARPQAQRGFNPIARYKAAGPWAGLGAPSLATGHRVILQGAQINDAGRLSAADTTVATVMPLDAEALMNQVNAWDSWSELMDSREKLEASLLTERMPMKDWVALRPEKFGKAHFDEARQTLIWQLSDGDGRTLEAELAFNEFNQHAFGRIEALDPSEMPKGTLVIARIRAFTQKGAIVEPLSLVYPNTERLRVDCLYFDETPKSGFVSSFSARLKQMMAVRDATIEVVYAPPRDPFLDFRHELQRQAERGVSSESREDARADLIRHAEQLHGVGFKFFRSSLSQDISLGEAVLRSNYLILQSERLQTSSHSM